MSAQEQHGHDDEERIRQQGPGEHTDPNRPPRVDDQQERQHPGGNPGDPGAAPAPAAEEDTNAEQAKKREDKALEDGSELPG